MPQITNNLNQIFQLSSNGSNHGIYFVSSWKYPTFFIKIPKFLIASMYIIFTEKHNRNGHCNENLCIKVHLKSVEGRPGRGTRYNLLNWHISSWLFTKLDDFLPFVYYMVEWSLHNKKMHFLLIHNSWKTGIWFLLITEQFRCQFEATVFNQEQLSYCT